MEIFLHVSCEKWDMCYHLFCKGTDSLFPYFTISGCGSAVLCMYVGFCGLGGSLPLFYLIIVA